MARAMLDGAIELRSTSAPRPRLADPWRRVFKPLSAAGRARRRVAAGSGVLAAGVAESASAGRGRTRHRPVVRRL
jgi:hypothetical protein